jgi:exo-1,4-beta-D-glucosaminidase
MVRFSKPFLLALTAVTLTVPGHLAAQAKTTTPKAGSRGLQAQHAATQQTEPRGEAGKTFLHKDWQVQSSCDDKAGGDKISAAGFVPERWHRTDIPATVVGVLVTDKTYPDPNYGTNLKNFPGIYIAENKVFANVDMPTGSPFACSWWFRTEFTAPADGAGKNDWLHFNGINYRANIWVNGQ